MADQKINELPTKTAPSTGDKMLMIGTAEEYQIDYDQLATAILNKLSTQSFSSLDTTSKTVLGAIDELNSKTFLLKFGISINANEDLNNLTEIGTYYSTSSTITASLTNCPMSTYGFFMIVSYATGTDPLYIRQTIYGRTDSYTPIMYARHKSSSEWGEWVSFSDDATVSLYQTMTSTNDVLQSAENQPAYQTKFYWLGGAGYTGDLPSGGSYSYGTAIALKRRLDIFVVIFSIDKPIYNSYVNNGWSGWKDCTGTLVS